MGRLKSVLCSCLCGFKVITQEARLEVQGRLASDPASPLPLMLTACSPASPCRPPAWAGLALQPGCQCLRTPCLRTRGSFPEGGSARREALTQRGGCWGARNPFCPWLA